MYFRPQTHVEATSSVRATFQKSSGIALKQTVNSFQNHTNPPCFCKNSRSVQQHPGDISIFQLRRRWCDLSEIILTCWFLFNWKFWSSKILAQKIWGWLIPGRIHAVFLKLPWHAFHRVLSVGTPEYRPIWSNLVATRTQPTTRATSTASSETEENAFGIQRKTTMVRLP